MTINAQPPNQQPVPPLVEQFKHGLDAPICLTWEWTYACNLTCEHCLSSSGRRDPDELTTGEIKAVLDELSRMQVFYITVGGGEPTVRPDFGNSSTTPSPQHRRQVLHQRHPDHLNGPAGSPPLTTSTSRLLDGATAEERRDPRPRLLPHGCGHGQPGRRRHARLQDLGGHDQNVDQWTSSRRRRLLRRPAADHPTAPGRGATCGTSCTHRRTAAADLPLAARPRENVLTGDSFFHLTPSAKAPCPASTCAAPAEWCA